MSKQLTRGAVVVARVSTEIQVDRTSLDTQVESCHKKAAQLGLPVVATFREEGRSGAYLTLREGMNEAIGLIQSGAASHLITADMTRFSRDSKASQDIKRLVEVAGGTLVFCDFDYTKSATGNAQFNMGSTFSQWYRESVIEKTSTERRKIAESGVQPSRSYRPFGYLIVNKNHAIDSAFPYTKQDLGRYIVVDTEAHWAREMFTQYAAGSSLRDVCRFLEENAVPTPRGGDYWRPSTLKRILGNPTYKGMAPFGRHENVYDETRRERGLKLIVSKRVRPESEWVSIPCPAIVDEATWDACQARLADGQARSSGNPKNRHLLSGLLRCPLCRRGMNGAKRERRTKAGGMTSESHYHCPDQRPSRNVGGVVCNPKQYDGKEAEAFVTRAMIDVANGPGIVAAALQEYRQRQGVGYSEEECKRLQEELRALDRREQATANAQVEALEAGASTAVYVSMLKDITAKRNALKVRIDQLCAQRKRTQGRDVNEEAEIISSALSDIESALTNPFLSDGEKHGLLARVIEEITPTEEGYSIKLRPFEGAGTVATILLVGPPGSGKTMLARRVPSILPPLTLEESLDVTKIYSVGGLLGSHTALVTRRPFRSPHHSISNAALAGGGSTPRPGEVSLSHNGILFLDELPEFKRDVLEVLRQPLEDGHVTIARVAATMTYPARLMLVAAMNPCPCGYYGDTVKTCACSPPTIAKYLQRISGPLLDRIDIHIEVPRLRQDEMIQGGGTGEPSASIRGRVLGARERQKQRFDNTDLHCNAHMGARQIKQFCHVADDVKDLLRAAISQLGLSARAYDRILKLSRTIADLDAQDDVQLAHVAEAIQYRALDRKLWG